VTGHDIIVIGASAGGVEALKELVSNLPADLSASIFVVLHISAESKSLLPDILDRLSPLKAITARNGLLIEKGHIYVAPPDYHLLVEHGYIRVVRGPKENRHRPAVDPLFRSAALAYGSRVVGVVLTGNLDDGSAGLQAIKQCGGISIVQDPDEAAYPGMPRSAMESVEVDYCLPLTRISDVLAQLTNASAPDESNYAVPENIAIETSIARMETKDMSQVEHIGRPSGFSCPECSGTLWELKDEQMLRFRCQVGHAYTSDSLQAEQQEGLEDSLWAAVRALQEVAAMNRRMAIRARERNNNPLLAERFEEKATVSDKHAAMLRQILLDNDEHLEKP
jgi:two-component system, chemotaxis family, protein-glutamate methylesterase/glutaminase